MVSDLPKVTQLVSDKVALVSMQFDCTTHTLNNSTFLFPPFSMLSLIFPPHSTLLLIN